MTKRVDPKESRLFDQIQELCTLCAKGIVKISNDTGYSPSAVAKLFVEVFREIVDKMDSDR